MIKKTQTFLVDSERLLKEKLLAVKSMNHELDRLNQERVIIEKKKNEAQYAYHMAQRERIDMRMLFERQQMERD